MLLKIKKTLGYGNFYPVSGRLSLERHYPFPHFFSDQNIYNIITNSRFSAISEANTKQETDKKKSNKKKG